MPKMTPWSSLGTMLVLVTLSNMANNAMATATAAQDVHFMCGKEDGNALVSFGKSGKIAVECLVKTVDERGTDSLRASLLWLLAVWHTVQD